MQNQNPLIVNQNDVLMHFLAMNRNDKVATNACNEKLFSSAIKQQSCGRETFTNC
jgi:hypothetical protein